MHDDRASRAAPASPADERAVRQALLAVCVLDEVDLVPTDAGVLLPAHAGGPDVLLDWGSAAAVLGSNAAGSAAARPRLRSWLALHRVVADLGADAATVLARSVRALGLHPGGALHPGHGWVRDRVLGGVLDLGLGVVELLEREPGAVPLWPDVAAAAGLDPVPAWARARTHLEAVGALASTGCSGTGGPRSPAPARGPGPPPGRTPRPVPPCCGRSAGATCRRCSPRRG